MADYIWQSTTVDVITIEDMQTTYSREDNGLIADPAFRDADCNFALGAGSPAFDAGIGEDALQDSPVPVAPWLTTMGLDVSFNGDNIGMDYEFLGELIKVQCTSVDEALTTPDGLYTLPEWVIKSSYDFTAWKVYTGGRLCDPDAPFNDCCSPCPECRDNCSN